MPEVLQPQAYSHKSSASFPNNNIHSKQPLNGKNTQKYCKIKHIYITYPQSYPSNDSMSVGSLIYSQKCSRFFPTVWQPQQQEVIDASAWELWRHNQYFLFCFVLRLNFVKYSYFKCIRCGLGVSLVTVYIGVVAKTKQQENHVFARPAYFRLY